MSIDLDWSSWPYGTEPETTTPAPSRSEREPDRVDPASLPIELLANPFMSRRPRLAGTILVPMPDLDEIEWADLRDAYGPARWVPTFIRALTSDDAADRDWAAGALHASVIHQGHTDPASLPATRAIVGLVGSPDLPDPAMVLYLLARLAVGEVRWCLEEGIDFAGWPKTECFDAVLAGVDVYLRLLEAPKSRLLAAFLLALLPPAAERAVDPIRALVEREEAPETKAGLVLAYGVVCRHLGGGAIADEPFLGRLLDGANHPLVRLCSVMAVALARGRAASSDVTETLREVADRQLASPSWPWPWTDDLEWTLADMAQALWESITVPDERAAREAVRKLFPSRHKELWVPAALSNEQRQVLERWLSQDWYWPPQGNDVAGLPRDRALLARVGRQEPLQVIDREVEPTDGSRPAWPIWRLAIELARGSIDEKKALDRIGGVVPLVEMPRLSDEIVALLERLVRAANGGLVRDDEPQVAALVSLAASLLGRAGADGVAYARRDAEQVISAGTVGYGARLRDALALARYSDRPFDTRFEPLLVVSPPAATYPALLREPIAALPPDARSAFLRGLDLYGFSKLSRETPAGQIELRFFTCKDRFWRLLDLCPEPWMAETVLEARAAYEGHMAAEAVRRERGFAEGFKDDPFPDERALELLALVGPAARPALERLAAAGSIGSGPFLDEARRRVERTAG